MRVLVLILPFQFGLSHVLTSSFLPSFLTSLYNFVKAKPVA